MVDLVCLGELLVDMFPSEMGRRLAQVGSFIPKPGGAPANVAVAASHLGVTSAFIGKVGDDAFGHHLAEVLRREGVDIRGVHFDRKYRTTMAFIAVPDPNKPEFVFYRNPGADLMLRQDEIDRELLLSARVFHFGSLSLVEDPCRSTALEAARIAHESHALVSFDANYRPDLWASPHDARDRILASLRNVDLLKVNELELRILTGDSSLEAAQQLLHFGPKICVVTLGGRGSYYQTRMDAKLVPAFQVSVVDATGCGDGFVAGLVSRILASGHFENGLQSSELEMALRYANAVGAITATKQGAIPALPTAKAVRDFLRERGEEEIAKRWADVG